MRVAHVIAETRLVSGLPLGEMGRIAPEGERVSTSRETQGPGNGYAEP
jgi:hypothetical protein